MAFSLSVETVALLQCPVCGNRVAQTGNRFACARQGKAHAFPAVHGRPVLLNEETSVFAVADFIKGKETFWRPSREGILKRVGRRLMPNISNNLVAAESFERFAMELKALSKRPVVLVVGGSIEGEGMQALLQHPEIQLVETDVAWGPRTQLICDIHDLPFTDAAFDGVVVQAVLEHVVDPYRGAEEIHRVLKPRGVVYAETPFMQQVHGGQFDFTRFTFLGHRRLFRRFEEITSGVCCGPGMALAWSWYYFFRSMTRPGLARQCVTFLTSWTSFFLKYFDHALQRAPAARDAASGYYFMGRKSKHVFSDKELITSYRE